MTSDIASGIIFSTADPADLSFIRQLLVDQKLPTQDLLSSPIHFILAEKDQEVIGCIGLELYDREGFLRSFAVDEKWQGLGLGNVLFNQALDYSRANFIDRLHLLTTTAESFFAKKGFLKTSRNEAPLCIHNTTEFKGMCGSTAVYMVKSIT